MRNIKKNQLEWYIVSVLTWETKSVQFNALKIYICLVTLCYSKLCRFILPSIHLNRQHTEFQLHKIVIREIGGMEIKQRRSHCVKLYRNGHQNDFNECCNNFFGKTQINLMVSTTSILHFISKNAPNFNIFWNIKNFQLVLFLDQGK